MLVMAFEGKIGHACESWTELVRKCGYKAVVTKQECGDFIVEIKPDNTYSKLVPPFEQLYSKEYGKQEAVEDLCEEFAKSSCQRAGVLWRGTNTESGRLANRLNNVVRGMMCNFTHWRE